MDWVSGFWRDGYAIAPWSFEAGELAEIRPECERLLGARDAWTVLGAAAKSRPLSDFAQHDLFRRLSETLIGPDIDLFWDSLNRKPSGRGKAFAWHQDSAYGRTEPVAYITCWTAFDTADEQSGCLCVVPGSHEAGPLAHTTQPATDDSYQGLCAPADPHAPVAHVRLQPGQVAVLHSCTLHRSGPNTSDHDRLAYITAYVRAGTRYLDLGLPSDAKAPAFRSAAG